MANAYGSGSTEAERRFCDRIGNAIGALRIQMHILAQRYGADALGSVKDGVQERMATARQRIETAKFRLYQRLEEFRASQYEPTDAINSWTIGAFDGFKGRFWGNPSVAGEVVDYFEGLRNRVTGHAASSSGI